MNKLKSVQFHHTNFEEYILPKKKPQFPPIPATENA